MLGPPTPLYFLDELPLHYKVAYYPERAQPYTIWLRDKVVRFEVAEMGARKWVERAAIQSRDWPSNANIPPPISYTSDRDISEFVAPNKRAIPLTTTSVNYWEFPKPSDRAEVIE